MIIHASEQDSCNDGGEGVSLFSLSSHFVTTKASYTHLYTCLVPIHKKGDFFSSWSKGQPLRELPLAAGYPVGAGGYKSFRLQVHYDNPEGKEGVVDSSGFLVYFSKQLRQYDAGYMRLGDASISLFGQNIPSGLSRHVFDCPPTRSQNHMNADKVTVFIVSNTSVLVNYVATTPCQDYLLIFYPLDNCRRRCTNMKLGYACPTRSFVMGKLFMRLLLIIGTLHRLVA